MSFVTPSIALCAFVIIIILALIIAQVSDPSQYEESRAHIFLLALAGLGVFITFLFYYSVVELQQQQQKLAVIQQSSKISATVFDSLLDEIKKAGDTIPNFTISLLPLISCQEVPPDPVTSQACIEKSVLSYKIFSLWQTIILANEFVNLEGIAYITNFLQRAHSSQLYELWKTMKIDFNTKTQKFGDLLFESGLQVTPQTPAAYVAAAQVFVANPAYQELIAL